ncbi:hypothetical protein GCM10010324_20560 [Streptomyces hiroshimensis]|uniref:Uncharacterized protein n=1 Tax=Streptomyces hiroshimensis TaxID=66424 RepID=A0ABQ2Y8G5_9ACTN|nr:hypothetical protein GCM10010324_20560 [Streptomyces hiroshimensis]
MRSAVRRPAILGRWILAGASTGSGVRAKAHDPGSLDRAGKVRLQPVNGQGLDDPQFPPTVPAAAGRMAGGDPGTQPGQGGLRGRSGPTALRRDLPC